MIEMFFAKNEPVRWLTLLFLPALVGLGWIIHFFWMCGLGGWWSAVIGIMALLIGVYYFQPKMNWGRGDLRWIIAPISVAILAWYLPWWDLVTVRHSDAAYHLIESNSFIGLIDWVPKHQGNDFFYRPPIVPALFSIEILILGNRTEIFLLPLLLLVGAAWQIQHLAERWTSQLRAALTAPIFLVLPVIRYWGQLDYLDVVGAGMWILTLHALLLNESHVSNKKLTVALGIFAAATFLCKYVHIYMIGLVGWFVIKDRNIERVIPFIQGWLAIAGPYFLYFLITQGDVFAAISVQSSFAVKSAIGEVGSYSSSNWWIELKSQLTMLGIVGCGIGMVFLWIGKKSDFIATCVLLSPLLILHAFVLDHGEIRYHTPWLALAIALILTSPNSKKESNNGVKDSWLTNKTISSIGVIIIIFIGMIHVGSLSDERELAINDIEQSRTFLDFQIGVLNEITDDAILIVGHEQHIGLITNIPSYRFEYTENPITDAIDIFSATHVMTTNVAPRFTYEKEFDWQLGHGSIELETIHTDGWWSAVLWRVDNTTYLSPDEYYSNHTGNVTGDLLILGPNESFTVGDNNLSIKWIEVTTIRPYQQVMKTLAGEEGLMTNGSIDGGEDSFFYSHEQLISPPNKYIYAWILPHSL